MNTTARVTNSSETNPHSVDRYNIICRRHGKIAKLYTECIFLQSKNTPSITLKCACTWNDSTKSYGLLARTYLGCPLVMIMLHCLHHHLKLQTEKMYKILLSMYHWL